MRNSDLKGVDCKEANFSGADLQGARMTQGKFNNANFSGADLQGARMTQGKFNNANFSGADLQGARMTQGKFNNANFSEANLQGAGMTQGNFSGANLSAVKNIERARLKGAFYDEKTIFPDGFKPEQKGMVKSNAGQSPVKKPLSI